MTMTPREEQELKDKLAQQVMGQQEICEQLLKSLGGKGSSGSILTGPAGAGRSAILKEAAKKLTAPGRDRPYRLEDFVPFQPFTAEQVKQVVDKLVDQQWKVPAARKDEAKAIVQELIAQEGYDGPKGLRGLKSIVKAVAAVSSAPDMREALTGQFPVFARRASMKSGEQLAESFTGGTAIATQALKPLRLKSRGVGFFSLH